jgi:UDP:flavonoid glycosyltransferase YjiC (YdhE family)
VTLPRYDWTHDALAAALGKVMTDPVINANLARTSKQMQTSDGSQKGAALIDQLLRHANRTR